jgi:hypothetical protein
MNDDCLEEETSNFTMKDVYKVLRYLAFSKVDRQIPVDFEKSIFVDGDSVVLPTIHGDFNGTDLVQVFLNCHDVDVDVKDIVLGFSPLLNGNVKVLSLNPLGDNLDKSNDTMLQFKIDENFRATDKSRLLTGIESITLDFGTDATGIEIQNLFIKTIDYTYTIDDLKVALENGEAYVLRRLNDMENEKRGFKEIPKLLKQYIYMAAGAYAWLTRWEYEAKPMKEPKSESNNYADRLFAQVDDGIRKYLSNIENNRDEEYLNLDHVTTAGITWGVQ